MCTDCPNKPPPRSAFPPRSQAQIQYYPAKEPTKPANQGNSSSKKNLEAMLMELFRANAEGDIVNTNDPSRTLEALLLELFAAEKRRLEDDDARETDKRFKILSLLNAVKPEQAGVPMEEYDTP